MDKRRIRESFSRAAGSYDDHSAVQAAVAEELAELVRRVDQARCEQAAAGAGGPYRSAESVVPGRILDVGCGTGTLTGLLAAIRPGCPVTALDIALPMAERVMARVRAGGAACSVVAADCDELPFADASFDLVASNMAYQWSTDPASAFSEAARVLVPGGFLAFSSLGPGTFAELNRCLEEAGAGRPTPSAGFAPAPRVRAALEGAGLGVLHFETRPLVRAYRDMWELLRKVKRIGASPRNGDRPAMAVLRKAARIYAERFPSEDGEGIEATYEIIYTAAARSS